MEEFDKLITELSDLVGIIPEYYDIFGTKHVTSKESRVAILSAMGLQVGAPEEVSREILKIRLRSWLGILDPVFVISVNAQPFQLPVHLAVPEGKEGALEIRVAIEGEQGRKETVTCDGAGMEIDDQRTIADRRYVRYLVSLPARDLGYYTVAVSCSHREPVFGAGPETTIRKSARLIITPDACHMPDRLQSGKTWGIAVNLYALRSERNWGVGDLGDLRSLVGWASRLNAGLIGINPLHDIPNTAPFGVSPYSPITRLYRNFIYIDMDRVEELASIPIPPDTEEKIKALRTGARVDYEGVASVKRSLLERAFHHFYANHFRNDSDRGRAFGEYLSREGEPLEQYALFVALSEHLKKEDKALEWPEWPDEYRSPERAAVRDFRDRNEERVLFFAYLQWLIDTQMAEVSAAARSANLAVGLYGDLAIGAHEAGSDAWMYQGVLAEQVSVGAPPDDFNHNGQDWGFPPMIPDKLRESGYDLFIRTIRQNMRHLGALRFDHVAGIFRLFWIPKGMKAADGAYVRCHAEDLLRIIALESVRNRTLVVGEDLGTITDEMRDGLHRFGMLSYRLFYFERNHPDPSFLPPERYPAMALSAVTTHDLPTLYGFWSGRDLEVKGQLGISDESQLARQKSDRDRDRNLMVRALEARGMLHGCQSGAAACIPAMTHDLCCAIYQYLSASPSKLVLVSLDDVIGTMDQQNLPGTVSEYPNWMQKTSLLLEQITADQRWHDLAGLLQKDR
jgi:4-alpha-glucanotransferase